jgi:RNA polymerase sigma-70 factor, ECF subfamily
MAASEGSFDFEAFFQAHYERIARSIARIIGDRARAEDFAVEAFWRLWRHPKVQGANAGGWVYRTAVRLALNDLRGDRRRSQYEAGRAAPQKSPETPEQAHAAAEERRQVRHVLALLDERQAELLLLRTSGLSYEELATAMDLNPASVGTFLSRAQQAFRKEYLKRYGEQGNER